ncbi:MAG: VOC family protein [Alphaproteobacteria bacterium]|nr:VOC family protein [Alphaproteobacteria bacterium]
MPKITHIALKVKDIAETSRFYETVFGFQHVNTVHREGRRGSHISRHLTDGAMDLTLMQYEHEDADEADFSGPAPCIHHFGIEVDDVDAFAAALTASGGEILSQPGKLPVKFRAPGGPVAEVVPRDRYRKKTLAEGTHGPVIE